MWLIPSAGALGETLPVGHKITLKPERGTLLLKAEGEEGEGGGVENTFIALPGGLRA